jgi:hypothetical protein
MPNISDLSEVDALGQPLHPPSEDEAREADMRALIEFNLTLTPAERLRRHCELMNFFQRVQRVAAKRYRRKIDIQVIGLA